MPWEPDYISDAELSAYLHVNDDVDDVQVLMAVTAASRAVDDHTGRQFGQVAAVQARQYTPWWSRRLRRWMVDVDDFQDAAGLIVALPEGPVDVFTKEPINAAAEGMPWTRIVIDPDSANIPTGEPNELTATAKWGWLAIPVTVKQATALQSSRFLARRNSPYGVAGSPDLGSELRLLSKVDPDVAVMLKKYVRPQRWFG